MEYKAEVTKVTLFGVPDHEEQTFDTRHQAEAWIKMREPFGYSKPKINGEPVEFSQCDERPSIARMGEERRERLDEKHRELFRANARRNSLRVLKPSSGADLDALYAGEDASCAG